MFERKPEFWEEPSQVVGKLGKPLNMTCSPDMVNPEPEITWQVDFKSAQNKVSFLSIYYEFFYILKCFNYGS